MRISTRPILAPGALIGVLIVGVAAAYFTVMRDPVPEITISSPTAAPPATQPETPWLREISIRVDRFDGPSGVPAADDFVDILLFRTNDGQETSSVIMRSIRVIAADRPGGTGNTSPSDLMVIVEVDPTQAKKLAVAQQVGALVLVSHEVSLSDDPKKRPVELFQRGPYRMGEMPIIPYGDYTQPPGGGILH
jgi:hypothetical protein